MSQKTNQIRAALAQNYLKCEELNKIASTILDRDKKTLLQLISNLHENNTKIMQGLVIAVEELEKSR